MLEDIFLFTAGTGVVGALLNVVGVTLYDSRVIKRQRHLLHNPNSRQYRPRPLITVLIGTRNDEAAIERCVRALWSGSYRKVEIIVVDGASSDATRQLVRRLQAEQPKRGLRLVARRTPVVDAKALLDAYKTRGQGEWLLCLDVADAVDKQALTRAVQLINATPELDGLRLNRRAVAASNMVGLFQQYQDLLRGRSRKLASVLGSDYAPAGQPALHRRQAFLAAKSTPAAYYASDAITYVGSQTSLYRLLRQSYGWQAARLAAAVGERRVLALAITGSLASIFVPFLFGYFVYLAFWLQQPDFLLLSCAGLSLFVLLSVWGESSLQWRQKFAYSLLLPITYVWFAALSLLRVVALLTFPVLTPIRAK